MQPTYLRDITEDEKNNLYDMMDNDAEAGYRAKIILLRSEGYTVAEIRRQTNHHDNNIRKWIHRFNDYDIDGIVSRKHNHTTPKITDDMEKEIVRIASANPRKIV
jgi:transposase-like protein